MFLETKEINSLGIIHHPPVHCHSRGTGCTPVKADFTDSAHIRLLPCVGPHVPGQLSSPHDELVKDGTLLGCLGLYLPLFLQGPGRKNSSELGSTEETEISAIVGLCLNMPLRELLECW